jgi:aminoglycoside phosphotransferase (APT) family kinase protein
MIEQIAAIHTVDLAARDLQDIDGGGRDHLSREVAHWKAQMSRADRGSLPALELLAATLSEQQPAQPEAVTLVHSDTKPGNIAFSGDAVSAVFDWEMATVGDPLTDIGWIEMTWMPWFYTPGAPPADELLARYEQLTGIRVMIERGIGRWPSSSWP